MNRKIIFALIVIVVLACGCLVSPQAAGSAKTPAATIPAAAPATATATPSASLSTGTTADATTIALPEPRFDSSTSVEKALKNRRSVRSFTADGIAIADVSQLLWAAQGITSGSGQRTAPSAQRIYPLQVYVIAQNVSGLAPGAYRYVPAGHQLEVIGRGDMSPQFRSPAPVAFVIAIDPDKRPAARQAAAGTPPSGSATSGNGSAAAAVPSGAAAPGSSSGPSEETIHAWYYAESGHAAENMYLQAESLDLGMVTQAGFDPVRLRSLLGLSGNVTPFYFIPAGHPA